MAQDQGLRWQKLLQYEHEQRLQLEDMVEQLGKQHSNLEKQIRKSMNGAQPVPDTIGLSVCLSVCRSVSLSVSLSVCVIIDCYNDTGRQTQTSTGLCQCLCYASVK